jgi:hypothetical protein
MKIKYIIMCGEKKWTPHPEERTSFKTNKDGSFDTEADAEGAAILLASRIPKDLMGSKPEYHIRKVYTA